MKNRIIDIVFILVLVVLSGVVTILGIVIFGTEAQQLALTIPNIWATKFLFVICIGIMCICFIAIVPDKKEPVN